MRFSASPPQLLRIPPRSAFTVKCALHLHSSTRNPVAEALEGGVDDVGHAQSARRSASSLANFSKCEDRALDPVELFERHACVLDVLVQRGVFAHLLDETLGVVIGTANLVGDGSGELLQGSRVLALEDTPLLDTVPFKR